MEKTLPRSLASRTLRPLLALLALLFLVGCEKLPSTTAGLSPEELALEAPAPSRQSPGVAQPIPQEPAQEIDWDSLIPEDWRPDQLLADFDAANLADDDPQAQVLMSKLQALWNEAPVVASLDGQWVRLPGFVVPLELDAAAIHEFLLVPYYGACIHVPPPPANQTLYVITREDAPFSGELFDTLWVTGRLRVERHSSELAEAGYRLENATWEAYSEPVNENP